MTETRFDSPAERICRTELCIDNSILTAGVVIIDPSYLSVLRESWNEKKTERQQPAPTVSPLTAREAGFELNYA